MNAAKRNKYIGFGFSALPFLIWSEPASFWLGVRLLPSSSDLSSPHSHLRYSE